MADYLYKDRLSKEDTELVVDKNTKKNIRIMALATIGALVGLAYGMKDVHLEPKFAQNTPAQKTPVENKYTITQRYQNYFLMTPDKADKPTHYIVSDNGNSLFLLGTYFRNGVSFTMKDWQGATAFTISKITPQMQERFDVLARQKEADRVKLLRSMQLVEAR